MSRLVNIPNSIPEIQESIQQKVEQLIWWLDKLNRSRKNSLRSMRSLQVEVVREQLAILRKALEDAREQAEIEKAQAFVARLAPLRKDFLNGLFN